MALTPSQNRAVWAIACTPLLLVLACGTPPASPVDTTTADDNGPGSVADVTVDGVDDRVVPGPAVKAGATASVRNETDVSIDATLRFMLDGTVSHLAFVRVLPGTIATVESPRSVDSILMSGIDELGGAIAAIEQIYGTDFSETEPAEFLVTPSTPDPGEDPNDDEPEPAEPPTITLDEPADDVDAELGGVVTARWTDAGGGAGAVVMLYARPLGEPDETLWIPLGPAVGATLDGINDELSLVVQGLPPGLYELVAVIDDGTSSSVSVAPGLLQVSEAPGNEAPAITLMEPSEPVLVQAGGMLVASWEDSDADDNATITFSLETSGPDALVTGSFPVGPPIAEDPDGAGADNAVLLLGDILPGLYDLVATIDDGSLRGTSRVAAAVTIEPLPGNLAPTLTMLSPASDTSASQGGAFYVAWQDDDANDNARISIVLDPDTSGELLDGDEIVLISALSEDDDAADFATLGVPSSVVPGDYRVLGIITDGLVQIVSPAPGLLEVLPIDDADPAPGDDPPDDDEGDADPLFYFVTPSIDLCVGLEEEVEIRINGPLASDADSVDLYLTNRPFGGSLRIVVTPPGGLDVEDPYIITPSEYELPNETLPRSFVLRSYILAEGVTHVIEAPGILWVRPSGEVDPGDIIPMPCDVPVPDGGDVDVSADRTDTDGNVESDDRPDDDSTDASSTADGQRDMIDP